MNQQMIYCDNMCPKQGIPSLEDESVHLVFFSPPYWNYIDYEGGDGVGNREPNYESYLNSLSEINKELWKKIIPGGRVVINTANMKSRKKVEGSSYMMYPISHHIASQMQEIGFNFYDEIVWNKFKLRTPDSKPLFSSYPYPPTPRIMNSNFENIQIFNKLGNRPSMPKEVKNLSKLTLEEWREFTKGIWNINGTSDRNHPATFPIELAERVIRLYSFVGDVVLDPFAGSGTTLIACEKWNRNGIGYEIAEPYKESYYNRRNKYIGQLKCL